MSDVGTDHGATIAAWRARGDHRHDPVRFALIEAMVRRALVQQGAARRIIDDRLAQLLASYGEGVEKARLQASAVPPTSSNRSALTELASQLADSSALRDHDGDGAIDGSMTRTLKYVRSTWSKLSAERQLFQSHATVPDNPGPLNSHHLVHQALRSMRHLSPGYLGHFMSHVDALFWLDDANGMGAAPSASAQRDPVQKKPARKTPRESSREPKGGT